VLCTRDRTYALKHVQTTNTVLLMPCDAEVCSLRALFATLLSRTLLPTAAGSDRFD
jgi:Sister chromatid cohesion protein Dcc1